MSFIIVGKVAGASIGLCLVAMSGLYMVAPTTIDNWMAPLYSAEVYGFLTKTAVSKTSTAQTLNEKKWQCQIEGGAQFDCTVKEVTKLTDVKKHILLKDFLTKSDEDRGLIDVTAAFDDQKLYQIKDIELNFKNRAWRTNPIKVSYKSGSTTTELGSITSMFMLQGRATTFVGKTTNFIGQASEKLDSTTSYKCSWDSIDTVGKECKIFPFVDKDSETQDESANISKLEFKKDDTNTAASEIKKNHYYLIQFTNEDDVTPTLENFQTTEIIYLKDETSTKVTFNNLSAVTVVEDQLLILKKHS